MNSKAATFLTTLGLLALTTSCAGAINPKASRGYEIPGDVCGVKIDKSQYEPLFLAGKRVEEEVTLQPEQGESLCVVRVDGKEVFDIDTNRMSYGWGPGVQGAISARGYRLDIEDSVELEESPYEIRIWPNLAIAYIECAHSDFDSPGIGITFYINRDDESDYTDTLSRIMEPYIEGRLAQIDPSYCTPA